MGRDRDPQSIASAFLLSFLFHNTLVSGEAGMNFWAGLSVLPGGAPTLWSLPPRDEGREGEGGAARRPRNLTLGGHFTAIQCSESAASSHFQQERFPFRRQFNPAAGKAGREIRFGWDGRFPSLKRGGQKPRRGRLACRFSGIQTHLVQFIRLWNCSTVRVVCSW